jgi:Ni/Co efflux regulator RcnB
MKKIYLSIVLSSLIAIPVLASNTDDSQHKQHHQNQAQKSYVESSNMDSHNAARGMKDDMHMMEGMAMDSMTDECRQMMRDRNMENMPNECQKMMGGNEK